MASPKITICLVPVNGQPCGKPRHLTGNRCEYHLKLRNAANWRQRKGINHVWRGQSSASRASVVDLAKKDVTHAGIRQTVYERAGDSMLNPDVVLAKQPVRSRNFGSLQTVGTAKPGGPRAAT